MTLSDPDLLKTAVPLLYIIIAPSLDRLPDERHQPASHSHTGPQELSLLMLEVHMRETRYRMIARRSLRQSAKIVLGQSAASLIPYQ
jgi:hypothetical protein